MVTRSIRSKSPDPRPTAWRYTHTVEVTATDPAGNARTQSTTFEIDRGLEAWIWVLIVGASIVVLGGAGYRIYRQRLPEFDAPFQGD